MKLFFGIPFFKNTDFLEKTLKSLLKQTTSQWVATVFDDSIDPMEAALAQALVENLNDSRIHYSRNPQNLGMAANWNQVLDAGKTFTATCILHADDQLMPRYAETMIWALETYPQTTAFFCETHVINENGERTFSFTDFYKKLILPTRHEGVIHLTGTEGISQLIPGNFVFCPTLCFRNSLLDQKRFNTTLKMVTDFDFILQLLMENQTLTGIYLQPLFEYRRHSQNTTKILTENLTRFQEEKELYLSLAEQLELCGKTNESKAARQMKIVRKNLVFQASKSLFCGNFSLARQYFAFLRSTF